LKLAPFKSIHFCCGETFFGQVITIPNVFIASETEEMVRDATTGGGELDLVGIAHKGMLAVGFLNKLICRFKDRPKVQCTSTPTSVLQTGRTTKLTVSPFITFCDVISQGGVV